MKRVTTSYIEPIGNQFTSMYITCALRASKSLDN